MQDESWYQLVETVFPHRKPEMDYLRDEPRRVLAITQAQSFGRTGSNLKTLSQRDKDRLAEQDFLHSIGRQRMPVGAKKK